MRWTTTLLLIAIVGGLGLWAWLGEEPPTGERPPLFAFPVDKVSRVRIERPDLPAIVLERDGERWKMTEPLAVGADKEAVEGMLRRLTTERPISELPSGDAASFGLSPARATVTVSVEGKTHVLEVGQATAVGSNHYARRKGETTVLIVAEEVAKDATLPVSDYRNKRPIDFDKAQVTEVEIVRGGTTLRLANEGGRLWLLSPRLMASREKLDRLLGDLTTIQVKRFVSDAPTPEELARWGLDTPQVSYHLAFGEGKDPLEVQFGRKAERDEIQGYSRYDQHYIRLAHEPYVYLAEVARTEILTREAKDLREEKVLPFRPNEVASIEILRGEEEPLRLRKDGEAWRFENAGLPTSEADAGAVQTLLAAVSGATAEETVTDPRAARQHGLARPAAQVRLTLGSGMSMAIAFGEAEGERLWVRSTWGGTVEDAVLGTKSEVQAGALRSYADLRDRRLFDEWDDGGAEIVVTRSRDTTRFVKNTLPNGEKRWVIPDSADPEIYRPVGISLERALAKLEAASFVLYAPVPLRDRDLRPYGLRERDRSARVRAVFRGSAEGEAEHVIEIDIGSALGDGTRHARLTDDLHHVFLIPRSLADDLLGNLSATVEERITEGTSVTPPPGGAGR
ncbi:MAG: DUF4340 domain-containing protein [Planctomycetes bacterium]|nr:DUF4340 domain-containing protein [Planctomycetota bacterium]